MNICPQVPVAAHRDIKVNLELSGYKVIRLGDRVQLYQVTPWAGAWRIIYTVPVLAATNTICICICISRRSCPAGGRI